MKDTVNGMKISSHKHINGWDYGYCIKKDLLGADEIEWLNHNLGPIGWFYTWDAGVVNRILCFREHDDLLMFALAFGAGH